MSPKPTLQKLVQDLDDAKLKAMVHDALGWRNTGILSGNDLGAFVDKMLPHYPEHKDDIHRLVESYVLTEAALRYINS